MVQDGQYNAKFEFVFGIEHPTQDAVAQALATYMRTILSGDSLYDRAEALRKSRNAATLTVDIFRELLKWDDLTAASLRDSINSQTPPREDMPALLAAGHALFHGKARCVECHQGPIFSDQDYHNIGIENPAEGKETGRSVHVPIGLKETRLVGGYRTPTLRNLGSTNPYFHDGSRATLREVVEYFDFRVLPAPGRLAKALQDGDHERRLSLSDDERLALVTFLRSLQGAPVDRMVAAP